MIGKEALGILAQTSSLSFSATLGQPEQNKVKNSTNACTDEGNEGIQFLSSKDQDHWLQLSIYEMFSISRSSDLNNQCLFKGNVSMQAQLRLHSCQILLMRC